MNSIPSAHPSRARWTWPSTVGLLSEWLSKQPGLVAELARDELADITRLTETINALAKRIGDRVRQVAPALLALPGCGELTAAKVVGEAAGVGRFKSEAAFARHAGVAPIPVWSGNTAGRVRMTRSGNRQLNAALHRIAVTQIRLAALARPTTANRCQRFQDRGTALPHWWSIAFAAEHALGRGSSVVSRDGLVAEPPVDGQFEYCHPRHAEALDRR